MSLTTVTPNATKTLKHRRSKNGKGRQWQIQGTAISATTYLAAGVESTLRGNELILLIIDDPIKNYA